MHPRITFLTSDKIVNPINILLRILGACMGRGGETNGM